MDTLVLGCTHYPLLENVIGNYMGPGVTLVSAGAEGGAGRGGRPCGSAPPWPGGAAGAPAVTLSASRVEDFSRLASIFLGWDVADSVGQVEIGRY